MVAVSMAMASVPKAPTAPRTCSSTLVAAVAVPIVYFLFTNLMNASPPAEGSGIIGYIMNLPVMGKFLFGTFLISVPGILIWSFVKGSRAEFQMMVAAMVLIVFNVVFLDAVRTGWFVPHPVC
jgi:POT family proton-dependent oligopeptide transporter